MKKSFFKVALVAAFTLIAGYNVYNAQKEELALSDLMLENVEALASYEIDEVFKCYGYGCYINYNYDCYVLSSSGYIYLCFGYRSS